MKKYYPYPSDKKSKKYFIITNDNKKVYFGDSRYEHYIEGHLDHDRRGKYMRRHRKNENWDDKDTPGFWSYQFLWWFPTCNQAYENIKKIYIN
jgi:hypothetical protein